MPAFKNITGMRFGRLTAIERAGYRRNIILWRCLCDCGSESVVTGTSLRFGHVQSCGCLRREQLIERQTTHGYTKGEKPAKIYYIWAAMIQRCTNPNSKDWKWYGAHGITVCEHWKKFEHFLADMGEAPPGLQLDRRDNDLGYSKENCRWTTPREQRLNQRRMKRSA